MAAPSAPAARPAGPVARAADWFLPPRMGRSFRWLIGGAYAANLADGIILAASPLLVATRTDSALLISAAPMLNRLPWLLFGLGAGAIADRVDRKHMTMTGDLARVVVLTLLVLALLTGNAPIGVVLTVSLLLGVCEVVTDSAATTLLPSIVERRDLTTANARMMSANLVANQMLGPAVGAGLFALGAVWSFSSAALMLALAAASVSRMVVPRRVPDPSAEGPAEAAASGLRGLHTDVVEGLRWLRNAPAVRTLVLTILTFNVTWAMGWGVLVLYAHERLGLGAVGFGVLNSMTAVGGIVATFAYDRVIARWSLATVMRVCLSLEVLWHLTLALTTSALVAYLTMLMFGLYGFFWAATSAAVRQRATPDHMMGRMSSINLVGLTGGMVIGMPIGGVLADAFGITAPFWVGFVGSGLTLLLIWRSLGHIAHIEDPEPARH
ncbi:MFS transporter [Kytococcus sp. Marseille-QA3725]